MSFFLFLFIGSMGVFAYEIAEILTVVRRGRPDVRKDHPWIRLLHSLKMGFGQLRINERWWGRAHEVIFYAFLIFLIGTLELLIGCAVPGWRFDRWIGGDALSFLYVFQTYFAWMTILAISVVLIRRIVCRKQVYNTFDAFLILGLIWLLMFSHFFIMASMLAIDPPSRWLEIALPLTSVLSGLMGDDAALWGDIAAGVHLSCVSMFLIWIPRGKHLHIVFGFPALWFEYRKYDEAGQPVLGSDAPDLDRYEKELEAALEKDLPEDEWPTPGIASLADTTWKMRFDAYTCTQCRRCTNACPMIAAGIEDAHGPLNSMIGLRALCDAGDEKAALVPRVMTDAALWNCTQCGACDRACPMGFEHLTRIVAMRRAAVAREAMPTRLNAVFAQFERSGNPWGYPRAERMAWAKDIESGEIKENTVNSVESGGAQSIDAAESAAPAEKFDIRRVRRVLIFAGCLGSYEPTARRTLDHAVTWLRTQGFDVCRLKRESCCGEPMRKLGNETAFQKCMRDNAAAISQTPHDVILTACPHCAQTLRHEYVDAGVRLNVMHIWEFMAGLWRIGMIDFKDSGGMSNCILHMPCGLCKTHDPGDMLAFAAKLGIRPQKGDITQQHCCGAGGGQFFLEESRQIAEMRARELIAQKPDKIVTACPFCIEMIRDAVAKVTESKQKSDDLSAENAGISLIPTGNVIDIFADLTVIKPLFFDSETQCRTASSIGQCSAAD